MTVPALGDKWAWFRGERQKTPRLTMAQACQMPPSPTGQGASKGGVSGTPGRCALHASLCCHATSRNLH
eukprot:59305-Prorocentrum_lima.AAC.1